MDIMEYVRIVGDWIGNGFSMFVYIAIVLLFIIGIIKCIIPVIHNKNVLLRASKIIKKGDKARKSWQNDKFLGKGSLMPHWSEYLNNLFFADGEYHNPSNVEDYINEETVISGPGRAKFSEALPGVQVSLGFLGTLLGLSVALSNMNAADAAQITDSMTTLLSSMKYAFLTSIFGVVASITFTLLTRITHGQAERALLTFYNAMARYAGVLSVDPLTQVAIYQQEQTAMLKDVIAYIESDKMSHIFEPIAANIAETVDMTCERQQELLGKMADAYIAKLDTAMSGRLTELTHIIDNTSRVQASIADAVADLTAIAHSMHSIKDDTNALLDKLEAVLDHYDQTLTAYGENQDKQREYLIKLSSELKKLQQNIDTLAKYSAENLPETAKMLSEAGNQLNSAMNAVHTQLNSDMQESLDYFEATLTSVTHYIEKYAQTIRDSAAAIPESTEKYVKELVRLTGRMASEHKQL